MINIAIPSSKLSLLSGINHGFFTREGGVSSGLYGSLNAGQGSNDAPQNVQENRSRVAAYLGVESKHLISCYQVHSNEVAIVTKPWDTDNRPKADAIVTNVISLALGILTADCGPILFADARNHVIGAAHAGWKGAISGVLENTIAAMETLGAQREHITACLGMTISQTNYEVGQEFLDQFLLANSNNKQYFIDSKIPNHYMFNLPSYITERLSNAGVGTVEDVALCTYAEKRRFFSYRRSTHRKEPDYGRHISAIALI
jgi:polyphenol oxidase